MEKPSWLTSRRDVLLAATTSMITAMWSRRVNASESTVRHILPTTTDTQFSITMSLWQPRDSVDLLVGKRRISGVQTDSEGRHWSFHASRLNPDTTYQLQLVDDEGPFYECWPLKTLPDRNSMPSSLRLLAFTCAGGGDGFSTSTVQFFKPHKFRQRLFDSALAQKPDVALAIGEHIYWDLRRGGSPRVARSSAAAEAIKQKYGEFDRELPVLGTRNEAVLKRVGNEQIADFYGTRFRSTSIYFVADDHDYFENDDAEKDLVTFPPDKFSSEAHAAIAQLYYPPLPNAPVKDMDRSFGALVYGRLFETPIFDCAGHLSLGGDAAGLVPDDIEQWINDRTTNSPATHFAFTPSHPFGWTAGKWREWYPDVVAPEGFTGVVINELLGDTKGKLTIEAQKYLWQQGWWNQHQRLLKKLSQRAGSRFMLSGDIHAQGAVEITRSGEQDLRNSPVKSLLVGPVSTSDVTWPSSARGFAAASPAWLAANELSATKEINGFTMLHFTQNSASAELYDCGGFDRTKNENGGPQAITNIDLA